MVGIPSYFAFAVGMMVGALGYGPVNRWYLSVRREFIKQYEQPELQRKDSRKLLFIFATMHPAPWLFILGIPFALYQLAFGPLPVMWSWVIGGVLLGVGMQVLYRTRIAPRPRS
jgi:hypothetical protein